MISFNRFASITALLVVGLASITTRLQAQVAPEPFVGVTRWTCNAFYLPARSIWLRTVDVELNADGVRAVEIDGIPVYTFNIQGTTIMTAVDGERIQFNAADQTWTSDLRGIVSSKGRCQR